MHGVVKQRRIVVRDEYQRLYSIPESYDQKFFLKKKKRISIHSLRYGFGIVVSNSPEPELMSECHFMNVFIVIIIRKPCYRKETARFRVSSAASIFHLEFREDSLVADRCFFATTEAMTLG